MANGHGIFEAVQSMFDDETIPQNVSNRLIAAMIIQERKDRERRDCESDAKIKVNYNAIFGDGTKPGIKESLDAVRKDMGKYNRAVWIVSGAVLTGFVGLIFGLI